MNCDAQNSRLLLNVLQKPHNLSALSYTQLACPTPGELTTFKKLDMLQEKKFHIYDLENAIITNTLRCITDIVFPYFPIIILNILQFLGKIFLPLNLVSRATYFVQMSTYTNKLERKTYGNFFEVFAWLQPISATQVYFKHVTFNRALV